MRHVSSTLPKKSSLGPVVLQHGLGSNCAVFEYPTRCCADALANAGYDVYMPRLRGVDGPAGSYGLDAYIEHDIPAIIDEVRARSGCERLRWVGHSMGGVLLMMYAIEHPDVPISRFVAVGSALDYRAGHSVFVDLLPLRAALNLLLKELPFGQLARVNAWVAGRGPCLPPEKMNFWRANLEPEIIRHILACGFTPIPMQLLNDLSSALLPPGLARKLGALAYLERAGEFRLPTCLIAGSRDEQCPESAVEATARLLTGAPELRIARFGKRYGQHEDYGHFDLIVGARAPLETWPTILAFLHEQS
jgi:pimeloyl-ACP methyl ester carboxylesterase